MAPLASPIICLLNTISEIKSIKYIYIIRNTFSLRFSDRDIVPI